MTQPSRRRLIASLPGLLLATSGPLCALAGESAGGLRLVPVGPLLSPRATHAAVRGRDGSVTILGGFAREGSGLTLVERYDPARRRFEAAGQLAVARIQPLAVRLDDDSTLVMGGEWRAGASTAELLAPDGRSAPLGRMNDRRTAAAAVRLRDGRVLVCGGSRPGYAMTATAELYRPDRRRFDPLAPMREARAGHALTLLPDGRVLVTGGGEGGRISGSAELWDPATQRFSAAPSLHQARYKHAAVCLPQGDVLVVGGSDDRSGSDGRGRLASCEVLRAGRAAFEATASMGEARYKIGDAVVLRPDGRVVVAGGARCVEWYEPAARRFVASASCYDVARDFMTATLLADGSVLAAGGYDATIAASRRAWLIG